ncbi:hypothetical protein EQ826_00045 [Ectopseudomonas mendocina]|nr:hypothetical protein [Pseudomonas mendocina]TRO29318.1 hypothetical protein EQ826_00045 [Pseudomonas mendocina]
MSRTITQLVIDAKNNTKKAFSEVNVSLESLDKTAKTAGAALLGAFSVGVLSSFLRNTALAVDQMSRLAKLSGSSAEEFQRWSYASKTVGIEQDKLGDIFKDVQDKIGDFLQTGGGPMADFFENIAPKVGVTAEQFRNLSGPEALQLYVSSLQKANLSQSEMTFYLEAIANDAALLLPLMENNGEAITRLGDEAERLGRILDEQTIESIKRFNGSLRDLGGAGDGLAKQFTGVAADAANATGVIDTFTASLDRVSNGVRKVNQAEAPGWMDKFLEYFRFLSRPEFTDAALGALLFGFDSKDSGVPEQVKAVEDLKEVNTELVENSKVTTDQLKEQHKSVAAEAKKRIREITAAEREANSEVERLRKERMEIEERYSAALAGIQAGSGGDPSLMQFNALKVGARQSLADGDVRGAQQQAQAALKVLQDLAAAGENTAGFSFFIRELKDIEVAAKGVEQSAADQKLEAITKQLEALKEKADIKITAKMSDEEIAKTQQQITELAAALSAGFVITPTIKLDGVSRAQLEGDQGSAAPKFAGGGKVTGPGTGTSDSILARLSNGEYVMRAAAVRQYGTAILDRMNGLQMPAFADGGLVEAAMAVPGATPGRDLGRVTLNVEGQRYEMLAEPQPFEQILRRQRVKFGRPRS